MTMDEKVTGFHHVSVMSDEVVNGLAVKPDGVYVDCTLGGGGHAGRIASLLGNGGRVVGIDRDSDAINAAGAHLKSLGLSCRYDLIHDNFCHFDDILDRLDVSLVDGVLFDLGVSSYQIDEASRGFSYMNDAPLDMRMDREKGMSARDVVNTYGADELTRIFRDYGEERWAKRIAEFIVAARQEGDVATTGELVDIIHRAVPAAVRKKMGGNPAKRVFQAIRIEVNHELDILRDAFRSAVHRLRPHGRIAIITFHSLEDRIAKNTLREMAAGCVCPPGLPVCVCHHRPEIRILKKAERPGADELARNSRARSAKLRIAERLADEINDAGEHHREKAERE